MELLDSYTQQRFVDAAIEQQTTAAAQRAPHVLMRPRIFPDGDQWCALLGEDLQTGVAGFGPTPEAAAAAFDVEWRMGKAPPIAGVTRPDGQTFPGQTPMVSGDSEANKEKG